MNIYIGRTLPHTDLPQYREFKTNMKKIVKQKWYGALLLTIWRL